MNLTIQLAGIDPEAFGEVADQLNVRKGMHAEIAVHAESFLKEFGATKSQSEHRTANRFGAKPTGHLAQAYEAIEATSDENAATLLLPRASRLRAAFGAYVLTPTQSQYLTLPVHADAYGRRAREFDLFPIVRGRNRTLLLARKTADGGIESMYLLTKEAEIPEDQSLIPFGQLEEKAQQSADEFVDRLIEGRLA